MLYKYKRIAAGKSLLIAGCNYDGDFAMYSIWLGDVFYTTRTTLEMSLTPSDYERVYDAYAIEDVAPPVVEATKTKTRRKKKEVS